MTAAGIVLIKKSTLRISTHGAKGILVIARSRGAILHVRGARVGLIPPEVKGSFDGLFTTGSDSAEVGFRVVWRLI